MDGGRRTSGAQSGVVAAKRRILCSSDPLSNGRQRLRTIADHRNGSAQRRSNPIALRSDHAIGALYELNGKPRERRSGERTPPRVPAMTPPSSRTFLPRQRGPACKSSFRRGAETSTRGACVPQKCVLPPDGYYPTEVFYSARNRPKIGFNFSTVEAGQSLRSVTSAESSAQCSGQFGSFGMRGITSTSTFFAVSAFAIR